MSKDVAFDFDVDVARIKRAFDAPDDVGSVIRIHYELERCLEHVITKFFKNPKKLNANRAGPRIQRLEALGIDGPAIELATAINDVRDGFAHRDREEIRDFDLEKLASIFERVNGKSLAAFKLELWGEELKFERLSPRQKFSLYGAACIGMLASLPHLTRG